MIDRPALTFLSRLSPLVMETAGAVQDGISGSELWERLDRMGQMLDAEAARLAAAGPPDDPTYRAQVESARLSLAAARRLDQSGDERNGPRMLEAVGRFAVTLGELIGRQEATS